MNYNPNEMRALWFYYGTARQAAKKTGLSIGTIIEAGTYDLRGRDHNLSQKTLAKFNQAIKDVKSRSSFKNWRALLEMNAEHPNVSKAIVADRHREELLKDFKIYSKEDVTGEDLMQWLMNLAYERNRWPKYKFSK